MKKRGPIRKKQNKKNITRKTRKKKIIRRIKRRVYKTKKVTKRIVRRKKKKQSRITHRRVKYHSLQRNKSYYQLSYEYRFPKAKKMDYRVFNELMKYAYNMYLQLKSKRRYKLFVGRIIFTYKMPQNKIGYFSGYLEEILNENQFENYMERLFDQFMFEIGDYVSRGWTDFLLKGIGVSGYETLANK
jgi:hypothetical protein